MMWGLSQRQTLPLLIEGCGTFSPCLCVCACTPPLAGGKDCKTAWSEVWHVRAAPFWLSSLPARPWIAIHRSLSSAADFHLLNSQKAQETIAQFIKQSDPMSQMPVCFLKVTYAVFHFAKRRNHPTFPHYFLYYLILRDRWCVCVDYSFKIWVISQFEKGRKMVKGILIENTKLIL